MILGENIDSVYSAGKEIQRVFSYGKLVWEKNPNDDIDYSTMPFTVKAVDDNVSVDMRGFEGDIVYYKYSINGGSWIETDFKIYIKKGDTVSFKGNNIYRCIIVGLSDIYGNIMSLQYDDNFIGQTVWLLSRTSRYDGYFESSDIRKAHNLILPATTLAEYCYFRMFYGCTSLTTVPNLPATTLAEDCYSYMFYGCTSLTTPPNLPATKLKGYCYSHMFYGCTSLTTVPNLPATKLTNSAYCYSQMFYGCTSLTTAKKLPATTLETGCYSHMFEKCTSLTTPPELPATTLGIACYSGMFRRCTSLTTAPELPATTLESLCYKNMFYGCTSLNYIKCYATDTTDNIQQEDFLDWTYGVSANGKLLCKRSKYGKNPIENFIPSTWTVQYI